MATRNRRSRTKGRGSDTDPAPPPRPEQAQAAPAAPAEKEKEQAPAEEAKPANVIRKGLYLSALIYVEGDMPAPDDFIAPATNALKSVLNEALKGEQDGLTMTLKKVEVQNGVEQDEEEAEGAEGEEEKFQF
jgi:hypothetical protein